MDKFLSKTTLTLSVVIDEYKNATVKFAELKKGGSVFYTDDATLSAAMQNHVTVSGKYTYEGEVDDVIADKAELGGILRDQKVIYNDTYQQDMATQAELDAEQARAESAEGGLDERLGIVEQLADISISGGDATIATASDFNNPTTEQKAYIPTVGAILDGADTAPTSGSGKLVTSGGVYNVINSLKSAGYVFAGVATPSTSPGTPTEKVFYIGGAGTYANFGTSVTVPVGSICVFKYNGSWAKEQIALFAGVDDVPTAGSDNLVKSGGVANDFNDLEQKVLPFDFTNDSDRPYYNANGTVTYNSYRYRTIPIKVTQGDKILFSAINTTSVYALAALKSGVFSADDSILGVGTNLKENVITQEYVVPADVTEVIICTYDTSIELAIKRGTLADELHTIDHDIDRVAAISDVLDFTTDSSRTYYSITGNRLTDGFRSRTIPISVNTGDIIKYKGINSTNIFLLAALKDGGEVSISDSIAGQGGSELVSGTYIVPAGIKQIVVSTGNESVSDSYVYFDKTTQGKIEDISGELTTLSGDIESVENSITTITGNIETLTSTKADKNIVIYPSTNPVSLYKDDVAEIYIVGKYLQGVTYVELRYVSSIFLRAHNGSSSSTVWISRLYSGDYQSENGVVIELKCTTAGGTASIGDSVGYVVFKDIAHFEANNKFSFAVENNINLAYNDLRFYPTISYYVNKINEGINNVDIVLPPFIYAVVGDNLQIFHRSVIKAVDYKNYSVEVICDYGKNFPRYFELNSTASQVGEKTLTYNLYDNLNKLVVTKSTTLKIVAKPTTSPNRLNVLTLGASVYTSGIIVSELNRRLTNNTGDNTPANPTGLNLNNINFIGRKQVLDIHQEASGGWGWRVFSTNNFKFIRFNVTGVNSLVLGDIYSIQGVSISTTYYLTLMEINVTEGVGNLLFDVNGGYVYPAGTIPENGTLIRTTGTGDTTISYSTYSFENGNPLWNDATNEIDFQLYSQQYCNGAVIDVLMTNMGINDFRSVADVNNKLELYVKPLLRKFHEDYPSGIVLLGDMQLQDITGGMGASGSASKIYNWYNMSWVYWYYAEKIKEMIADNEFAGWVIYSAISGEFDCENAYPHRTVNVDNRITDKTEEIGTNGAHPTENGRKLLSDGWYRTICAKLL